MLDVLVGIGAGERWKYFFRAQRCMRSGIRKRVKREDTEGEPVIGADSDSGLFAVGSAVALAVVSAVIPETGLDFLFFDFPCFFFFPCLDSDVSSLGGGGIIRTDIGYGAKAQID